MVIILLFPGRRNFPGDSADSNKSHEKCRGILLLLDLTFCKTPLLTVLEVHFV